VKVPEGRRKRGEGSRGQEIEAINPGGGGGALERFPLDCSQVAPFGKTTRGKGIGVVADTRAGPREIYKGKHVLRSDRSEDARCSMFRSRFSLFYCRSGCCVRG